MSRLFTKSLIAASVVSSLHLQAQPTDPKTKPNSNLLGIYVGGFGGWIFPYSLSASQRGVSFLSEADGGPLCVVANGTMSGRTKGFGGLHIGYEWMNAITPGFRLAPALEIEGSYFANPSKTAHFFNESTRFDEHDFINTLPMRIGTLIANGVLEFNNDYVSPYIGFGVGLGFISIHGADSEQLSPPEPGINHFNSGTDAFNTVFATQAKAGLRYRFFKHYRLSAEYRFIYLTSSDFTFGTTRYSNHPETSTWTVALNGMRYNTFTMGIDFLF